MEINVDFLELVILGRTRAPCSDEPEGAVENNNTDDNNNEPTTTNPEASSTQQHAHTPPISRNNRQSIKHAAPLALSDIQSATSVVAQTPRKENLPPTTPRQTPRPTTPRAETSEDSKPRKSKTTFDELNTKSGLECAVRWFEDHITLKEKDLTENQFLYFLRNLTHFYDWEIYEIFDILDRKNTGSVGWEEFYILLSLYAAFQSKKLTKFLYKHGSTVYQFLLDPVTRRLTWERFSRLGFMIGLSEDDMLETLQLFGLKKQAMEMLGQEEFLLFYFAIFNTIDTGVDLLKDSQNLIYSTPPGGKGLSRTLSGERLRGLPGPNSANAAGGNANGKCTIS